MRSPNNVKAQSGRVVSRRSYFSLILGLIPWLAIQVSPLFLLGYVIDAPVVMVPVFATAVRRRELPRAVQSIPGFFVLRTINAMFMLEAVFTELIANRTFKTYEKGH